MSRRYGSLQVLTDVSFVGRAGELVSLVGPNGAGKTTLVRCISDGHERSGGSISIQGVIYRQPAAGTLRAPRARPEVPDTERVRYAHRC